MRAMGFLGRSRRSSVWARDVRPHGQPLAVRVAFVGAMSFDTLAGVCMIVVAFIPVANAPLLHRFSVAGLLLEEIRERLEGAPGILKTRRLRWTKG